MAKVSLRIYNREIERLVEQGHTDEAIAHCRHILKTFPKHLETYRLLGKAYLEARRYNEAVDIFGRLLMAVPDDFVAHVGLSIIRDEEGKLNDAIWHMERAFEVQPSNSAIQGELQRLYGRRDGMEPPKVRMTRGALARIYVQGELYPQAIAEIRSVLAEDPQRADMQALLALSYFRSGQKSDATDLCNQLLKRYAYCFDANRIMVDMLPSTPGAVESTQVYRMHVGEMDPYANFSKGSIFETTDVPDASVNLERLEYEGKEVPMAQDWNATSLGFSAGVPPLGESPATDEQPDWLRASSMEEAPRSAPTTESEPKADDIPDFLREAGWSESKTPEQPTSIFDEEPSAASGLVQADLPDWLKGQVPSEEQMKAAEAAPTPIETPDWLSGLDSSQQAYDPFESTSAPSGDTDWLKGLEGKESTEAETPAAQPAADVPDWLQGLGSVSGAVVESAMPSEEVEEEPLAQPADLPDWLSGVAPKEEPSAPAPSVSAESLGSSAQEQDDAIAWLESLAAKHGAKAEELVTDPNKRSETPPEWVSQAQNIGQQPIQPTAEPSQPSQPQPSVESLGSSAQEQDDAIAWLESLAAKHGAKPEELVTDPNKRHETPPEWVSQAQSIGQQPEEPKEPAKTEWSENAQNIGEEFFAEFEKGAAAQPAMDETGMWLNNLDEKEKPEQPLERGDIPE